MGWFTQDHYKKRIKECKEELKKLESPKYVKEYIENLKAYYKKKIQRLEEEQKTALTLDKHLGLGQFRREKNK